MGRKRKESDNQIKIDSLQIQYVDGFEKEWSKALATILISQLKRRLEESETQNEEDNSLYSAIIR